MWMDMQIQRFFKTISSAISASDFATRLQPVSALHTHTVTCDLQTPSSVSCVRPCLAINRSARDADSALTHNNGIPESECQIFVWQVYCVAGAPPPVVSVSNASIFNTKHLYVPHCDWRLPNKWLPSGNTCYYGTFLSWRSSRVFLGTVFSFQYYEKLYNLVLYFLCVCFQYNAKIFFISQSQFPIGYFSYSQTVKGLKIISFLTKDQ